MTLPRTGSWYADDGQSKTRLTSVEDMINCQDAASTVITYTVEGWSTVTVDGVDERRWFDGGVMASEHAFYDPDASSWYWADADGSVATSKDVFIPINELDRSAGGKWVRFDENSRMVKGEDFQDGNWYFFDFTTGAMAKGEAYLDFDIDHTGWYYYDEITGVMAHGDVYLHSSGGKWVRYDWATGKMIKGLNYYDGAWYYFDSATGRMAHELTWVPELGAWHRFDAVTGRG